MGRLSNLLTTAGKSATRLGPLDALFAGADYAAGKMEGEDDIRALSGAAGSTAGGWGGAMGGAAIGTAILPGIGTGIGALVGGGLGSFAGGWGADRVDQAVRGNRGANATQRQQESNTGRNLIAGAGAVGGAAYGLNQLSKGKNIMASPYVEGGYRAINNGYKAARPMAGQAVNAARSAVGAMPGWGKLAALGLTAYGANELMGQPVQGAIDAVSQGRTDLRPNTPQDDLIENRMEADRYGDQMYNQQLARQREQTGFANQREYQDYLNQQGIANQERQYKRKFEYDDYMNRMDIGAKQAAALLGSYDDGMQRANQAAQTILNARYF